MAKLTLKIDGKNKRFVKDKMNLGALKQQAEFEQKMQESNKAFHKFQKFINENREFVKAEQAYQEKVDQAETEEEIEALNEDAEDIENMEGYEAYVKKGEQIQEELEAETTDSVQMFDDFAQLLVVVFDHQFTIDEVFSGLEVEQTLEATYSKIFANDTGKQTKKANTKKSQSKTA